MRLRLQGCLQVVDRRQTLKGQDFLSTYKESDGAIVEEVGLYGADARTMADEVRCRRPIQWTSVCRRLFLLSKPTLDAERLAALEEVVDAVAEEEDGERVPHTDAHPDEVGLKNSFSRYSKTNLDGESVVRFSVEMRVVAQCRRVCRSVKDAHHQRSRTEKLFLLLHLYSYQV